MWAALAALLLVSAIPALANEVDVMTYDVVAEFPHDPEAFTQGLEFDRVCKDDTRQCHDCFWESTGLYGLSSVRLVGVNDGKVLKQHSMDSQWFGEGLTQMNGVLYQLNWRTGDVFKYSTPDIKPLGRVKSDLQDGWGLTNDGTHLIVTDSSHVLTFLDPSTLKSVKKVELKWGERPLPWVNELEYIDGELWGNIWQNECIAVIDPQSGQVKRWVLMHGLLSKVLGRASNTSPGGVDVLNGIAWDARDKRLFVTGKKWDAIFQVVVKPFEAGKAPQHQDVYKRCYPKKGLGGRGW